MYNTGANAFNTDKQNMLTADSKAEHLINKAIQETQATQPAYLGGSRAFVGGGSPAPGPNPGKMSDQLNHLLARQKGVNHSSFLGALLGHKNTVSDDMMTRDEYSGDNLPTPHYDREIRMSTGTPGQTPDRYDSISSGK
jgi:hypothetical protein